MLCYMLIAPCKWNGRCKNGLLLWCDRILPALLPFSIISYILVASDNLSFFFSRILHPVDQKTHSCIAGRCLSAVSGILFGFPLGSKIIGRLSENGQLRSSEAQILLSVCNNISPVFITGYMSTPVYRCDAYMLPAITVHLSAAAFLKLSGCGFSRTASDKKKWGIRSQITFKIIDAGIMNGFETLLKLCGYIVIFLFYANRFHY